MSAEEAAYAVERRAQEHAKRQRRAVRSVATRARNELITTEKRKHRMNMNKTLSVMLAAGLLVSGVAGQQRNLPLPLPGTGSPHW